MKNVIIFLIIYVLLSLPKLVSAVYFASDKVYLFENGKPITTNSVVWRASYQTYFQICKKGVCDIGQQFYPVKIFKTKESYLLAEEEWKTQYHNDTYRTYLTNLMTTAMVNNTFNPDLSKRGEGCTYVDCIGGRIGKSRVFNFDISTGNYSEINPVQPFIIYSFYVIATLGLILIGFQIIKILLKKR